MDLALNNLQWLRCHKAKPNLSNNHISICAQLNGFRYCHAIQY